MAQLLGLDTKDILADGRLVQVLPDWSEVMFPLYAYHQESGQTSAKVRAFLRHVRELMV